MTKNIKITLGEVEAEAELNDSNTAEQVWEALPIEADFNIWGDEIYFPIPVQAELEDGRSVVALGDLGYWPPGRAFCIFYGRTPMSTPDEIRPASPVNVIGRVVGDLTIFKKAADSADRIRVEKV